MNALIQVRIADKRPIASDIVGFVLEAANGEAPADMLMSAVISAA